MKEKNNPINKTEEKTTEKKSNNDELLFDEKKVKKDKKKGKLSLGAMFEEIETYGYNYSFKSFLGQLLIVFALMGIAAYFYELKIWAILILAIACVIATPFMIKAQYKYKFENSKFDDASDYLQQMTTSFLKTKKIRDSLAETSLVLSGRRIQAFIDEAVNIIDTKHSATLYEDAFAVIEKEYGCDKMEALHSFLIKIEAEGGDFEDTLNLMINDNQSWVEMTYKYQKRRKGVQSGILMGIILSMVMCGILNVFIPKDLDTGKRGDNIAVNKTATFDYDTEDTSYLGIDNDNTTYWTSTTEIQPNYVVDIGKVIQLSRLDISWGPQCPVTYEILTSTDGKEWTTLVYENHNKKTSVKNKLDKSVACRYIKIQPLEKSLSIISIREVTPYENVKDSSGNVKANRVIGSSAKASSYQVDTGEFNITDGDDSTYAILKKGKTSSFVIDLNEKTQINGVSTTWGSNAPSNITFYTSTDNKKWTEVAFTSGITPNMEDYTKFDEHPTGRYIKIEATGEGKHGYIIKKFETYKFNPANTGAISLSISDYFTYQLASLIFLIAMVTIYTMSQTLMQGSWLEDKGIRKAKDIVRDYRYYKNFDLKQETIKYSIWTAAMVILGILIITVFKQTYLGVMVLACGLYYITMPKRKLKNTKKRLTSDIQKAFPGWVRDISISLNTQTVQNAIILSEPKTPLVMKPAVNQLIKDFTEDPTSYLPWSRFLSDFDVPEIKTAARMFYSINELSGESAKEQINVLIRRNSKSVLEADEKKANDAVSALEFAIEIPMGVSIIKLITDLVCLMIQFMSVTGQIGGM